MKNRGIIKRLVMGKPREKDFTEADLPATRFKQFAHVMRTRFGIIFRINLLAALFFVPFAVWDLLCSGYVAGITAELTAAEHLSQLLHLTLLQYGTEIPLIMLGCAGLAGVMYVERRICWGQSVKILADYGKGLKQSWLQFVLLGMLTGIVSVFGHYIFYFALLAMQGGNALLWSFALAATVLFAVLWAIAMMFAFCQSSLYNVSLGRLLVNSFIFAFKRLFSALLILIASLAPILVFMFMPWAFVKIIGYCLAAVFSLGFAATVQTVYCHGVFDKYINEKQYPDYVRMGLRGSKADSDDDDEADDETADGDTADDEIEQADGATPGQAEALTDIADTAPTDAENATTTADTTETGEGGEA